MPFFKCDSMNDFPHDFMIDDVVCGLKEQRQAWRTEQNRLEEKGGRHLPSPEVIAQAMHSLTGALFPMRLGPEDLVQESEDFYVGYTLGKALNLLLTQVRLEFLQKSQQNGVDHEQIREQAVEIVRRFAATLPEIRGLLDQDVRAAFRGDPAATSVDEVLLCYPGVHAMVSHRIAHELYKLDVKIIARVISELAHSHTGIDIHPGATIGPGCFIDHGTGVVIGETAIIGKNVRIYQAVTLGAKSFPSDEHGNLHKGLDRHPIVEDDVVIYAGATILGRIVIGKGSVIGGNVWLTRSVPANSVISLADPCGDSSL